MTAERFTRVALNCLLRVPDLAKCSQASVFDCMLRLSQLGLEPDGRNAHLIPYGNTATLIIDYKGYAELVMRSGLVASIHADKVCENDTFTVNLGQVEEHKIDYRKDRGAAYAYYCRVKMKDGSAKCEVMTKAEVDAVRTRSRAGKSGPWVTDYDEMAKKTVFRRCQKWLPISPEIRDALEKDDDRLIETTATPKPRTQIAVLDGLLGVTHEQPQEPELSRFAYYFGLIVTATADELAAIDNDIKTDAVLTAKEKDELGVAIRQRADVLKAK
jgi:recombination protein RecT